MTALSRINSFCIGAVIGLFHVSHGKAMVFDSLGSPEAWAVAIVAGFGSVLLGIAIVAFTRFVFELEDGSTDLVAAGMGVLGLPALYFHSPAELTSGVSSFHAAWLSFTLASIPLMGCGAMLTGPLRGRFGPKSAVSGSAAALALYPYLLEPLGFGATKGIMVAALLASLLCLALEWRRPPGESSAPERPGWASILCAATAVSALCSFAGLVSLNLPILPSFWSPLALAALSGLAIGLSRPRGLWPERVSMVALAFLAPFLYYETRLLGSIVWLGGIALCVFFVFELCSRRTARASSDRAFTLVWLLGGTAGAGFSLLVAPRLFLTSAELPLALALLPLLTPGSNLGRLKLLDFAPAAAMIAVFVVVLAAIQSGATWGMIAMFGAPGLIAALSVRPFQATFSLTLLYLILGTVYHLAEKDVVVRRNRFGTVRVFERKTEGLRFLSVGTTILGFQRTEGPDRLEPTGVMSRSGPVSDVFGAVYGRNQQARALSIGVGAGAVACFTPKHAPLVVVEANRTVLAIAANDRFFSYVRDCSARVAPFTGDPDIHPDTFSDLRFDLVFTHAFTGLGIPVHLLTTEQVANLAALLADGGVMATLVVDPFVDAEPPFAAAAEENGLSIIVNEIRSSGSESEVVNPAKLFVLGKKGPVFDEIASRPGWRAAEAAGSLPWTERHARILAHIVY